MCTKADKLQDNHDLVRGDCFYHQDVDVQEIAQIVKDRITAASEMIVNFSTSECNWIPSQKQLEEMVDKSKLDDFLNDKLAKCRHPNSRKNRYKIIEEQLLALYMYESFNQEWNSKKEEWE